MDRMINPILSLAVLKTRATEMVRFGRLGERSDSNWLISYFARSPAVATRD
jgi:hypothetical protein